MTHETWLHGGVTVKKKNDQRGSRSTTISAMTHILNIAFWNANIFFQLVSCCRSSVLLLHRWTRTESDLFKVSRSSMRPRYFPKKPSDYFLKCFNSLILDLRSLPEQLLLLQPQPFLLDLLQSHLIVASHDSAVGAGSQLPSLLHWSTLGDPLLVQGCKKQKRRILNFAYWESWWQI